MPDSPELNPIQDVRHDFRSHFRSSRLYLTWEDLMDAADAARDVVLPDLGLIRSVGT
ncbi:hypothetical protein [Paludisphaera soli]|uniref:hypothetical protein n=1 Tax=Paludisphaera soli TaxID=2712865 RepID=UPI0013EB7042|nr:hypothetical protein [Paludisphaera soli]